MFPEITPDEQDRLRVYFEQHLVRRPEGWRLDYAQSHQWAVIWWDKAQAVSAFV